MKIIKYFTIFVAIALYFQTNAQDVYRTQNGNMVITMVSSDTILKLTTKELLVLLNYENAKFEMKMDKSTFRTGNDSLDKKLALMKYEIIEFKGNLEIDNINTKGHPPLDFEVKGILSTNEKEIVGIGHLEHISSHGTYSCLLTLKFNIKKDDLGIENIGIDIEGDIQIDIVQAVLNKPDDE